MLLESLVPVVRSLTFERKALVPPALHAQHLRRAVLCVLRVPFPMLLSIVPPPAILLLPTLAGATPSTTYWGPSTAACQSWSLAHVTYDTYFDRGPSAGSAGAPIYPIDAGLTIGLLPSQQIQGEIGFDLLLPSPHPLYLNAKLGTPESSVFPGSPSISFGIYNVGFEEDVTDYKVLHASVQKGIPSGGYVSLGFYHGLNEKLLTNSDGKKVQSGLLAGFVSRSFDIGVVGLRKINFAADVQTGKNVLGAWGFGPNLYFADTVSLLTGPVFFFDEDLQPGGRTALWTLQLDVDIALPEPDSVP